MIELPERSDSGFSWRRYLVVVLAYGLLFFGFFQLSAYFGRVYEGSLWYPAAGLRLATVLLLGWRVVPGVIVTEVAAVALHGFIHPATRYSDPMWILLISTTPLVYGATALVFARIAPLDVKLGRVRDVVWLSGAAIVLSLVVATVGRLAALALGLLASEDVLPSIASFWIGDMIGIFMITPLLLVWCRGLGRYWRLGKAGPATGRRPVLPGWRQLALVFAVVWGSMFGLLFLPKWFASSADHLYWYFLFLPLIWVSFLRGLAGSVVGTFALTSGAAWMVGQSPESVRLYELHVLVISLSVTSLLMGASVSSQWAARSQLSARNLELECRRAETEAFVHSISHDLKNPLVTIGVFLGHLRQELERAGQSSPRIHSDIDRVHSAVLTLHELLDGLIEFSRAGRSMFTETEFSLFDTARRAVVDLASPIALRGVRVDVAPDLPAVTGDRDGLYQVFVNLVGNAVKFLGDQPDPRVEIGWRRQEGKMVFLVRDNGVGIESRYREKIFELFEKLGQEKEGRGVGLAVVKRIVEEHGGKIWAESEGPGLGTTFCFTLARV